jgi:hypothetical protein
MVKIAILQKVHQSSDPGLEYKNNVPFKEGHPTVGMILDGSEPLKTSFNEKTSNSVGQYKTVLVPQNLGLKSFYIYDEEGNPVSREYAEERVKEGDKFTNVHTEGVEIVDSGKFIPKVIYDSEYDGLPTVFSYPSIEEGRSLLSYSKRLGQFIVNNDHDKYAKCYHHGYSIIEVGNNSQEFSINLGYSEDTKKLVRGDLENRGILKEAEGDELMFFQGSTTILLSSTDANIEKYEEIHKKSYKRSVSITGDNTTSSSNIRILVVDQEDLDDEVKFIRKGNTIEISRNGNDIAEVKLKITDQSGKILPNEIVESAIFPVVGIYNPETGSVKHVDWKGENKTVISPSDNLLRQINEQQLNFNPTDQQENSPDFPASNNKGSNRPR